MSLFNESNKANEQMAIQLSEAANVVGTLKKHSSEFGKVIGNSKRLRKRTFLRLMQQQLKRLVLVKVMAVVSQLFADEVRMLAAHCPRFNQRDQAIIEGFAGFNRVTPKRGMADAVCRC